LGALLEVSILDSNAYIRATVLTELRPIFDPFLAEFDNLSSLFIATNDEVFRIRELAMGIVSRLCHLNPAYTSSFLRQKLQQTILQLRGSEGGSSRA
jgi:FKBP12-rapamycin complex-associated protein